MTKIKLNNKNNRYMDIIPRKDYKIEEKYQNTTGTFANELEERKRRLAIN